MKTNRIVAAIAAGSLLLNAGAAFAQAEEAQRRQQEYDNAREHGYWHPTEPGNPHPGRATPRQQPNDGSNYYRSDPRYEGRNDQRYDSRNDPRYNTRSDPRYDPRYYQRYDQRDNRWYPADHFGGDWHGGRGAGPNHDWYRGSRLPREYNSRHYVVDDWRGHHLSAPPSGYHWVQAGGDYVLAAIATGVIAAILLNQ
jgi:Ni/Co efflux regulator RcnB